MKYLIICLLFASCGYTPHINQNVEKCGDSQFRVSTWINKAPRNTIYTSDSYSMPCLDASQVDSAKKAEYTKAEQWLKVYNKIK